MLATYGSKRHKSMILWGGPISFLYIEMTLVSFQSLGRVPVKIDLWCISCRTFAKLKEKLLNISSGILYCPIAFSAYIRLIISAPLLCR